VRKVALYQAASGSPFYHPLVNAQRPLFELACLPAIAYAQKRGAASLITIMDSIAVRNVLTANPDGRGIALLALCFDFDSTCAGR
jgi:hypothetical protein